MTQLAMQDGALLMCDMALSTECCDGEPPLANACCFDDGVCADLTPEECLEQGGAPQVGVVCHDIQCPECMKISGQDAARLCSLTLGVRFLIVFQNPDCLVHSGTLTVALTNPDSPTPATWEGFGFVPCPGGDDIPIRIVVAPITNFAEGDGWFIGVDMTIVNCPFCGVADFNYRKVSNPCACPPTGAFPIFGSQTGTPLDIDATVLEIL